MRLVDWDLAQLHQVELQPMAARYALGGWAASWAVVMQLQTDA